MSKISQRENTQESMTLTRAVRARAAALNLPEDGFLRLLEYWRLVKVKFTVNFPVPAGRAPAGSKMQLIDLSFTGKGVR